MGIRAVFLDIDGVVVLSEHLHQEKIIMTAMDPMRTGGFDPAHGVNIDLHTHWQNELAGIGDHRIYEWLLKKNPNYPLSEDVFIACCESYYLENAGRLQIRPGFLETFETLSRTFNIAAVSSGVRSQVDKNLEFAGIAGEILFSDSADDIEAGKTKPHPAPYLNALKKMNFMLAENNPTHIDILPEECLGIEDTSSGVTSLLSAGMSAVHWTLVKGKFHPDATYKIDADQTPVTLAETLVSEAYPISACRTPPYQMRILEL